MPHSTRGIKMTRVASPKTRPMIFREGPDEVNWKIPIQLRSLYKAWRSLKGKTTLHASPCSTQKRGLIPDLRAIPTAKKHDANRKRQNFGGETCQWSRFPLTGIKTSLEIRLEIRISLSIPCLVEPRHTGCIGQCCDASRSQQHTPESATHCAIKTSKTPDPF